jgi:Winged helix DNA-binding domain
VTERVLTLRELNRTLLARQLLLERAQLPAPRAVERIGALQAQFSPSPYVALWSRLEDFRFDELERALADGSVVKATLMRATLHIVSREDYWIVAAALTEARLARAGRRFPDLDVDHVVERLLEAAAAGPIDRQQFYEVIRSAAGRAVKPDELWPLWATMLLRAELVHDLPSGSYGYYRAATLSPATRRLGNRPRLRKNPLAHLLTRYLAAFGPASTEDIASWTGLQASEFRAALESLPRRTFRDERGRLLHDLPDAPLADADTPAPPRLLPKWDSALLAYAPPERERILPERYRKTVIRKNGDVLPTFLVDGFVAGTWSLDKRGVRFEPFRKLSKAAQSQLDQEGERLAASVLR